PGGDDGGGGAHPRARTGEPGAAEGERDPPPGIGFLCGGARPPTEVMVRFIDENRDELGVEPICAVLQVAPSTYYSARPRPRWVRDRTCVATGPGFASVCFIAEACSRLIVGWRVASNMRTEMVLDALEMARFARGTRLEGLVAHSDAGSQFTSIRYGERLA